MDYPLDSAALQEHHPEGLESITTCLISYSSISLIVVRNGCADARS